MGYLSQKKSKKRLDLFLNTMMVLLGLFVFLPLIKGDEADVLLFLKSYFLHFFFALFVLIIIAFHYGYLLQTFLFGFLFIICFFVIGSSANIFANDNIDKGVGFDLVYRMDSITSDLFTDNEAIRKGSMAVSDSANINYQTVLINKNIVMIVNVNWSNLTEEERSTAFNNLERFIKAQNAPVIVVGDFGVPAWASIFQNFLFETELNVKNSIIWGNARSRFNPLLAPTVNLLAHKNVGIDSFRYLKRTKGFYPVLFELTVL